MADEPHIHLDLGRRLAGKLRAQGWSLERIAELFGVTKDEVYGWFENPKPDDDGKPLGHVDTPE